MLLKTNINSIGMTELPNDPLLAKLLQQLRDDLGYDSGIFKKGTTTGLTEYNVQTLENTLKIMKGYAEVSYVCVCEKIQKI